MIAADEEPGLDDYTINALRENHAGWSLLNAQNAPLAVSCFMAAFTGRVKESRKH